MDQRAWWSAAYGGFVVLTACCAVHASRQRRPDEARVGSLERSPLGRARVVRWLLLAFLPSTLLLGTTSHLSTDVASIPLLWVVPLAVYLATFVLAFARRSRRPARFALRAAVALGVAEVLLSLRGPVPPISVGLASSMLMLGLVAYAAHSQLAVDRPPSEHLTVFYLVIAAGGALGGLLNGLVAPSVFPAVWEYPLALLGVPLLLVGLASPQSGPLAQLLLDNRVRVACLGLLAAIALLGLRWLMTRPTTPLVVGVLLLVVVVGVGWAVSRSAALALVVVVGLVASGAVMGTRGRLHEARSFYGTYRVLDTGKQHLLVHGTTVHGTEYVDAARRDLPTTYYARSGPLGDVFERLGNSAQHIGAVGLGAGTIASYGEPGQRLTFFEIDPEVVRIARDDRYFHYLADSRAEVTTVTGDGRLNLARQPRATYDLLVLDAFSSDAIPVHLMTEEAVALYASRLRPGGVLMFHISNRVFDLKPVLSAAAEGLHLHTAVGTSNSRQQGATPTEWVAMSRDAAPIDELRKGPLWDALGTDHQVAWTDDYSSVLSVLRWAGSEP